LEAFTSQGGSSDSIDSYNEEEEEEEDVSIQGHSGNRVAYAESKYWSEVSPYWRSIIGLHHNEMVSMFGSLAIVDPGTIPVGMVDAFKSARVRWEL
jgi:hypothetical protein